MAFSPSASLAFFNLEMQINSLIDNSDVFCEKNIRKCLSGSSNNIFRIVQW